jgi:hypothetical protein
MMNIDLSSVHCSAVQLVSALDSDGYGYADYPLATGYGISVATPGWLRRHLAETGDWELVRFAERAWDDHQDVYSLTRRS